MNKFFTIAIIVLIFAFLNNEVAISKTVYVDADAVGLNDGSSWTDAFLLLQSALDGSTNGDEIWVAAGTYYPTKEIGGIGERYKTFQLKNGVTIYGGFIGTETILSQRNFVNNIAILSGDIGILHDSTDNCYHVFYHPSGLNLDSTAIINGFKITSGYANGPTDFADGGAMFNVGSNPLIINCNFTKNTSTNRGAAIFNYNSDKLKIINCSFAENNGNNGGGIYNLGSDIRIFNSIFSFNRANYGAGIENDSASVPSIEKCKFISNRAIFKGGAIANFSVSNAILINCLIITNSAIDKGGAVYNDYSHPKFINCSVSNNVANFGGGIANNISNPELYNSILWANYANENGREIWGNGTQLNYSCFSNSAGDIAGTITPSNCINTDPKFAGNFFSNEFALTSLSPCIDIGNDTYISDTTDIRGVGFPRKLKKADGNNGTVDIGAYEYKNGTDPSIPRYIVYVKYDALGLNNGSNWTDAFTSLQTALSFAQVNSEIWVARGTYKPIAKVNGNTDRHKTFLMKKGVSMYGGFYGNENDKSQRDWKNNQTILSGDIGIISDSTDNCFHIVTYSSAILFDTTDVFDGFVIKFGNSDNENPDNRGAAMILNQNGTPTIQNCTFEYNRTGFRGGAIYNGESATRFFNCNFNNNSSTTEGGAIFNYYAHKTIIKNCILNNNKSGSGGSIYNHYSDSIRIDSCDISYNSASSGGGVTSNYGSSKFNNCSINNNAATAGGGGIKGISSPIVINYCSIKKNKNTSSNGGGGIYTNGQTDINHSIVDSNSTIGSFGGGIYSQSTTNISYSTISNNSAGPYGGGIYSIGALNLSYCNISNNSSASMGGGIYTSSTTNISYCIIRLNNATTYGGGIFASGSGKPIINSLIIANNAMYGGGVYGSASLINSTVANNTSQLGGGFFINDVTNLKNSIIWGNIATVDGNEIYKSASTVTLNNSCFGNGNGDIFGTITATNCINTDPIFVEPNDNDFRVYGVSPCVDAGNNTFITEPYDIRGIGYPRKLNGKDTLTAGTVDMGAYEYKHGADKYLPPAISTPVLLLPENNDINIGRAAMFSWRKVENATGYRIQISNTNTFAVKFIDQVENDTLTTLTDLNPFMKQYWRVASLNQTDSLWSAVRTFTTNNIDLPAVTTNNITNIGVYQATCGGIVTDDGDGIVSARGVCWSIAQNPTITKSKTEDSTGSGEFTSIMIGLSANTTYYVRAYATNIAGTVYGSQKSFKTSSITSPPSSWNFTINTGSNAVIVIPKSINPKIDDRYLAKGDAIGFFYYRSGSMICAGYKIWNDSNMSVTVWGDNTETQIKDGFALDESFAVRIWDAQLGKVYEADVTYSSGPSKFVANGYSILGSLKAVLTSTHTISLQTGWNMISSYNNPTLPLMDSVWKNIENYTTIVKNNGGKIYIPSYDINDIGDWVLKEGYQVYMTAAKTLSILGIQVKPESTPISLASGWNLVSYLRYTSMNAVQALATIVNDDALILAKNNSGQVYIPMFEINDIGNMIAGQGYQMYLSKNSLLIYPANSAGRSSTIIQRPTPKYFLPQTTMTGNNAVLVLKAANVENGNEIGVFTNSNLLVGSGVVYNGLAVITIWGDNDRTDIVDGALNNYELKITNYDVKTGKISDVSLSGLTDMITNEQVSELTYSKDKFFMAKAEVNNNSAISLNIKPNPANVNIEIEFTSPDCSNTEISIYSSNGKLVDKITDKLRNLSGNTISYNVSKLSSGEYTFTMTCDNEKVMRKVVVVR
jgi:hypothetical protein